MPVIGNEVGLTLDQIVIATDFTPASEVVTDYARVIAKHFSSYLTVAHVVDLSVATVSEAGMVGLSLKEMRHDSAENMQRVINDLSKSGLRTDGRTLEAHNPAKAIVELAGQTKADLIVMGTGARAGLNKLIVGSCAEGVIHHAKCPVITIGPNVIKPVGGAFYLPTIVFATDLRHNVAAKAAVALAFAQDSVAKIYMCHILGNPRSSFPDMVDDQFASEVELRKLIPYSAYEWCSPECVVEFGDAAEHIVSLAKSTKADLIVLGAQKSATYFTHMVDGVVSRVLAESECPVMTVCTE